MKITFDIPETTVAVIMSFVYPDNDTNMMNLVSKTVGTDELKDGSVLVFHGEEDDDQTT